MTARSGDIAIKGSHTSEPPLSYMTIDVDTSDAFSARAERPEVSFNNWLTSSWWLTDLWPLSLSFSRVVLKAADLNP